MGGESCRLLIIGDSCRAPAGVGHLKIRGRAVNRRGRLLQAKCQLAGWLAR